MSAKSSSTIGFEKRHNPALRMDEASFRRSLVSGGFPDRPRSFSHIIRTNLAGPPLLECCPPRRDLSAAQFRAHLEAGATVLDARDTAAFGGVHIPGSINIGLARQTANWIGMVIEPTAELVLVVPDEEAFGTMTTHLHRIGYDRIAGYLHGGISAWQEAGLPLRHLWQISAASLEEKLAHGRPNVIDVRTLAEWETGHVPGATHLPLTRLLAGEVDLPGDEELVAICGVGYRGNIAASCLAGRGFTHVHSLAGGMKAWRNGGREIVGD